MARTWYVYNGVGDPLIVPSYIISTMKPGCKDGVRICAIYAPNGGSTPSFLSTNIRTYIANLFLTLVAQPDGNPGIKKYVYGSN